MAIMVEEGTANILTANQSSVETDLTGFSSNAPGTTLTRDITQFWHGAASIKSACAGVRVSQGFNTSQAKRAVSADLPYTFSTWLRGSGKVRLNLHENATTDAATWTIRTSAADNFWRSVCWAPERGLFVAVAATGTGNRVMTSPASVATSTAVTLSSSWTRHNITRVFGAAAESAHVSISTDTVQTVDFWADGLQLEQKSFVTQWHLGGATRSPEILTVPAAGVLNPQEGTVECWWNPINQPASTIVSQSTTPPIAQVGNYFQNNSWILWCGLGGALRLLVRGDNATGWTGAWTIIPNLAWYQLNRWYHIVVRWENADTFWVFIDGVRYGPWVSSLPFTGIAGNIMSLGRRDAVSGPSNALFDDLRISNRARTDAEILTGYESGLPLPVD